MTPRRILFALPLLLTCLTFSAAQAEWPADPAENLLIVDRPGDQVVPQLAATPDGGCYIAWYDNAAGNYDVYLQRLDVTGHALWAPGGILISAHPQNTWITDWQLIADSAGNAVLTFNDIRAGGDWDIYAYKISPDGVFLWGADGIAVSDNASYEYTPMLCEASNGDIVLVWTESPPVGDARIMLQRLSPAGVELLPPGGLAVAGEAGESPGFCDVVPSLAGDVIVSWVRDMSEYMSPRHFRAERFDATGASVWGAPMVVYDQTSLPMGYFPHIQPDGLGGAVLLWHAYEGGIYKSRVQHLSAVGGELFTAGGVLVSTALNMYHISPTMAQGAAGELYVFWDERNTGQTAWGIYGQRIDPDGSRAWSDSGRMFLPTDTLYKTHYRALPTPDGAMCFWIDQPGGYGGDRVRGFRVDEDGNQLWGMEPVDVATTPSTKGRLPAVTGGGGMAILLWEDDRLGTIDLFSQNVKLDGTLGGDATPVDLSGAVPGRPLLDACFPNPFNPKTTIRYELPRVMRVDLAVYDTNGRRVRTLFSGVETGGAHELIWDGRDEQGRRQPSGVYLSRLTADDLIQSRRLVLLK